MSSPSIDKTLLRNRLSELQEVVAFLSGHLEELKQSLPDEDAATHIDADSLPLECRSCSCDRPCEKLEKLLPSADAGRSEHVITTDVSLGALAEVAGVDRPHHQLQFERFIPCRHFLSDKQWKVVGLVCRDGHSPAEAARILDRAKSTISGHLHNARKVMEEFHARRTG